MSMAHGESALVDASKLVNFGTGGLEVGDWTYSPTGLTAPSYLPMLDPTASYLASSYPTLAALYTTPTAAYSATASTPTTYTSGDKSVAYGNNIWIGVNGSQQYQTSLDGITWTKRYFPTTGNYQIIVYGNGLFIAFPFGGGNTYVSLDGLSWKIATLSPVEAYSDIAFGNGMFIAISGGTVSRQAVSISTDGINWVGGNFLPSANFWTSIAYGNSTFVAITQGGSAAATSKNGIEWTSRTLPSINSWSSVTYGNGVFVLISGGVRGLSVVNSTAAATSVDGATWTARTLPVSQGWKSVIFGNGLFFAVGYPVAGATTSAATSPDGVTWTSRVMPSSGFWGTIAIGGPPNKQFFVAIDVVNSSPAIGATIALSVAQTTFSLPQMAPMRNVTPYIKAS
jgi:hypothetical protein